MEFEWDEAKDVTNRAKHGVSLGDAVRMDWKGGRDIPDARSDYGEIRIARYALLEGRLHVCVYTLRGKVRRIISLRKANERERMAYGIQGSSRLDGQ